MILSSSAQQAKRATEAAIRTAKERLTAARECGDNLHIDLAETALNDLLDRYPYKTDKTQGAH